MNQDIKNYLVILLLFVLIDIPMITIVNTNMYMNQFKLINGGPMNIGNKMYISTIVTYLLLAFGLYLFVIMPYNKEIPTSFNLLYYTDVIIKAILFGLVVFGVYDMTNLATINMYDNYVAIADTIWGGALCGIVTTVYFYLM
jgi:uncharacterized membrane protein